MTRSNWTRSIPSRAPQSYALGDSRSTVLRPCTLSLVADAVAHFKLKSWESRADYNSRRRGPLAISVRPPDQSRRARFDRIWLDEHQTDLQEGMSCYRNMIMVFFTSAATDDPHQAAFSLAARH